MKKDLNKVIYFLAIASFSMFTACDKDEDNNNTSGGGSPSPTGPGTVKVDISNTAGSVNVDETGATSYVNSSSESFNVTFLKYYLSNFELFNDTSTYSVPESYFLVDEADQPSTILELKNVPAGYYKGVRFMIGVDEDKFNYLTDNNIIPTGALDPANNMMWTWNTGYIHFKMEGTYNNSPDSLYFYHIGGMTGANAGQRVVEVLFAGDSLRVNGTQEAEIHLLADILKVFSGSADISLSSVHNVMSPNGNSVNIANNYAAMFQFDHLHN
jgi:hypothetical protein